MAEARSKKGPYVKKTKRELVALARLLLCLLKSTSNILVAIEELKKFFPRLQVLIVDDDLLPEFEALAYPSRWIIKVRRGIHEGLLRGSSRGRWTLVHELAHVLLQHPGRPARHRRVIETEKTLAGRIEREADIVTRSFLMPYDRMAELSVEQIKRISFASTKSIARRVIEFAEAKAARDAVCRRGLDLRQFTSEYGHREDVERQVGIVAHTICEVMRSAHLECNEPLEPIGNNIFSTAVLVAAASGLLFDAYGSMRLNRFSSRFVGAAALALAVLAIWPLRRIGGRAGQANLRANLRCAAQAALRFAALPPIELDSVPFLHAEFQPTPYDCFFLNDVRTAGEQLIINGSTVLTLENFAVYEIYNAAHDIRWEDIHEIEHLAGYFTILDRACTRRSDMQ